jgi:hypothetical protein
MGALRGALGLSDTRSVAAIRPGGEGRHPWLAPLLAIAGLVAGAAILFAVVGAGGEPAPSSTSPSPSLAAGLPTGSEEPTASEDVFPNQVERALIALLPDSLTGDCERGTYALVRADLFLSGSGAGKIPASSLSCRPTPGSGANEVLVRAFEYRAGGGNTAGDFNVDQAISGVALAVQAPGGDCATSARANGRWQINGQDAGAIVCFVDGTTGDAILYWSYPDARILVKATNQRGDSAALYDWFEQNARFIAP